MLNLLIKPLLGVAGDVVKGVVATKKAKAEQKVTEIKAKTELLNKQIKGEIDYDLTALQQSGDSWKDEAWTILFIAIIAASFIPWCRPYIAEGFAALEIAPDWFTYAMYASIAASFGIRGIKGMKK